MTVGTSGTINIAGTNLIPEIATDLVKYDLVSSPIVTMMAKLNQVKDTHNPTFQWQEIQFDEPTVNCTSGIASEAAAATQSLTIDSLAVVWGDTFLEPTTNQLFEVVGTPSYNTSTGIATILVQAEPITLATTAVAGTPLLIRMGNTFIEGGYYPESIVKQPIRLTNTITQVSASVAITRLMEAQWTYYGDQFQMDKEHTITQFRCDMERRVIWGKQFEESRAQTHNGNSETGNARGSRGIWNSISTNVATYTGALTEATLDSFLVNQVFGHKYAGGDIKLAFSGPQVLSDISTFVKNKVRILNTVDTYGLAISEYVAPFGNRSLYLIEEKEFFENPAYLNTMVVLDPGRFYLYKAGPTLMQVFPTSNPGKSEKKISFESWFGVGLRFEKSHAILKH